MIGKKSELGDRNRWNLDEMISFADGIGEESQIFNNLTKSDILNICLKANGDSLVDWTDKEGGFNKDNYVKMIEFANRFAKDEQFHYSSSLEKQIREGDVQLVTSNGDR